MKKDWTKKCCSDKGDDGTAHKRTETNENDCTCPCHGNNDRARDKFWKAPWTSKCTCENFQQNEDCEHIGNKVLEEVGLSVDIGIKDGCGQPVLMEEVGLGVGDKDCPDCKVDVGCDKHYIQDGDRHDRLEGALTPLGYADINLVIKEITRLFLPETSEGSWNFTHRNDKVKEHISQTVNYKLEEIKKKIIEKSTFEGGVSSNGWYQIYKDDLDSIL